MSNIKPILKRGLTSSFFVIINKKENPMIVKTKSGYQVKSEKGKNLSKPNLTKEQAKKRLAQVEYHKSKNK